MWIIFLFVLVIFFIFFKISKENFKTFSYYLKMSKLSNVNTITLTDTLNVDSTIKTLNLCIDGFCITQKDLYFLPDIPRTDKTKIYYKNLDITENEIYKLSKFWYEGMIISFFGDTKNIPDGWALCDGKNGTPNLINKFVLGSGKTYKLNEKGGIDKVVIKEQHLPKHRHSFNPSNINTNEKHQPYSTNCSKMSKEGSLNTCPAYIPLIDTSMYTGTTKITSFGSVGNSKPHNNLPPYYGLYFIMKLKEKEE